MIGLSRPVGQLGCVAVAVKAVVLVAALTVAPLLTVVVVGSSWAIRRWRPDRLLALAVLIVWAAPAVTLRTLSADVGPVWWRPAYSWDSLLGNWSDSLAVVVTALSYGPFLGALQWLVGQRRRERSPYAGRDEYELRQRCEERRRRWMVQTAHRVAATNSRGWALRLSHLWKIPLGDGGGPYLGRWQRGDLGTGESKAWRAFREHRGGRFLDRVLGRRVRLPMGEGAPVHHAVMLGGTGLGKSESVLTIVEWAMINNWQVLYLTAKEAAGPDDSVAPRILGVAARVDRSSRVLAEESCPFDLMRGSDSEIIDRLVKTMEWGDEYWRAVSAECLTLTVDIRRSLDVPVESLDHILDTLGRLKESAKATHDRALISRADGIEANALAGAVTRYRSLGAQLGGWVSGSGWSWEDADTVVVELPTGRRPEAAAALLRAQLRDFGAYLRDGSRRQPGRRILLVVEEAGAFAADRVVGADFLELVERGRSAGVFSLITAQDPLGLGDERARSALLSNAAVISFGQGPQAELVAALAGTRSVEQGSIRYGDQLGNAGVTQRQQVGKLDAQLLRELGVGELTVSHRGRFALAAAGRAVSSYTRTEGEVPAAALGPVAPAWAPTVLTPGPAPTPTIYGPVWGWQQGHPPDRVAAPDQGPWLAPATTTPPPAWPDPPGHGPQFDRPPSWNGTGR